MNESEINPKKGYPWLSWLTLLFLLGVALALRWRYVREISLFVDEFVTAWAARNVWNPPLFLPIFPSGNLYPHGLLFTYLVAPFVAGEFNETLARLPGLLIGLLTLPVVYATGRRLLSETAGLVAAAAMAVDPACIVWGGRARMYGLLQLLTLLVVYMYYRGLVNDRRRDRTLAMGLLVAAVFTHAEAAFLLPVLGLATLIVLPWRQILSRDVILPFALGGTGAAAFYLLAKYGQPGHLQTLEQEGRSYLNLTVGFLYGPQAFAPYFTAPHHLPFTLLALVGIWFLFHRSWDQRSPLSYLYVVFGTFSVLIVLGAGVSWQRERYLFLVLPFLFLLGGEIVRRILASIPGWNRPRSWQASALAILTTLYIGLSGTSAAYVQEWGYDRAFRALRDGGQFHPADRLATAMSTAAYLYLDRNDAFVIQRGYEEYIVTPPESDRPVDLWTATPVLTRTTDLVALLTTSPRLWFVTDGWRFQTRYEPAFIQTVVDQMALVYDKQGALIFQGEGYRPPTPPAFHRKRQADFDDVLRLTSFGLSSTNPSPGQEIEVSLDWQALEQAGPAYTVFLHLVAPGGQGVAGLDEPLLGGLYQPALWPVGVTLTDRHRWLIRCCPPDLPPGRYRLDLGLYPTDQPGDLLPVEGWDRLPLVALPIGEIEPLPPPTATPAHHTFGNQFHLLAYDLHPATDNSQSATYNLVLYWQALVPPDRDYTVFVHLLDPGGEIATQDDAPPGDPFFPTRTWLPDDVVRDEHSLTLPDGAPPGDYTLLVGLYHQPSGERLGDAVLLTTLTLPEAP